MKTSNSKTGTALVALAALVAVLWTSPLFAAEVGDTERALQEGATAQLGAAATVKEEKARFAPEIAEGAVTVIQQGSLTIPTAPTASDHYKAGRNHMRLRQYDDAIREFEISRMLDPNLRNIDAALNEARLKKVALQQEKVLLEAALRDAEVIKEIYEKSIPPRELEPATRPDWVVEADSMTKGEMAMQEKLNQLMSMEMTDMPLDYILDILFRGAGVNFIADPAILTGKKLTIQVDQIPLRELIDYITRTLGLSFTVTENAIWITTPDTPILQLAEIRLKKGLIDVLGGTGEDDTDSVSDMERWLEKVPELTDDWPAGSQYYLDKKMNVLYVRSTESTIRQVRQMLSRIDVTPVQVHIETRFIEIASDDLFDLGVQWDISKNFAITRKNGLVLDSDGNPIPIDPAFPALGFQEDDLDKLVIGSETGSGFPNAATAASSTNGLALTVKGVLTDPQFVAVLNALEESGKATILSSPNITTVNNSEAEIKLVNSLVYVEGYDVDRADISGTSFGRSVGLADLLEGVPPEEIPSVLDSIETTSGLSSEPVIVPKFAEDQEVGFTLRVRPSVGVDNREITLLLKPEITQEIDRESVKIVFPGVDQETVVEKPIIATRALTTRLTIADKSTVVIGGLVTQKRLRNKGQVPFFGSIPLLGELFKRRSDNDEKTNLLIFVTARITTPEGRYYEKPVFSETSGATAMRAPVGISAVSGR